MESDLLAKFRKPTVKPVEPSAQVATSAPDPLAKFRSGKSKTGGAIASALNQLKGEANTEATSAQTKLAGLTKQLTEADKQAQAVSLEVAKSEVPADIFTLPSGVHELDGFPAEQFSTVLAATYQALVNDQPDLAKLLEKINTNLRQYEALSYLLTPEQIGLYIDGLMKLKQVNIKTVKKKSNSGTTQVQIEQEGGLDI